MASSSNLSRIAAWINDGVSPYSNNKTAQSSSQVSKATVVPDYQSTREPQFNKASNDDNIWGSKKSILNDFGIMSEFSQGSGNLSKKLLEKKVVQEEEVPETPKATWDDFDYISKNVQRTSISAQEETLRAWSKKPSKPAAKVVNKGRGAILKRNIDLHDKLGTQRFQNQFIEEQFTNVEDKYFEDPSEEEPEEDPKTKSSHSSKSYKSSKSSLSTGNKHAKPAVPTKEGKNKVYTPPHRRQDTSASETEDFKSLNQSQSFQDTSSFSESGEELYLSPKKELQPQTSNQSPKASESAPTKTAVPELGERKPFFSLLNLSKQKTTPPIETAARRNLTVLKMLEKDKESETISAEADNAQTTDVNFNTKKINCPQGPTEREVELLMGKLAALQQERQKSPDSLDIETLEDSSSVSDEELKFNEDEEAGGYSSGFSSNDKGGDGLTGEEYQVLPIVPKNTLKLVTVVDSEDEDFDDDKFNHTLRSRCPHSTYGAPNRGTKADQGISEWLGSFDHPPSNTLTFDNKNFPNLK